MKKYQYFDTKRIEKFKKIRKQLAYEKKVPLVIGSTNCSKHTFNFEVKN